MSGAIHTMHGVVLRFAGSQCRDCGQPATQFLVRPVAPESWMAEQQMALSAAAYCESCSPPVKAGLVVPVMAEPSRARSWWQRVLTH